MLRIISFLDDGDEEVRKFKLWQYFNIEDKESVSCMLCQESIRKPDGFGLVISRHFDKFHRHQLESELLEPKQEPIEGLEEPFDDINNDDDDNFNNSNSSDVKSARSKVWKYFEKVEKDFSKCKTCFCIIKTQKGNTSGMSRHLARVHSDLFEELEQEKEKEAAIDSDDNKDDDDFSPFRSIIPKTNKKKKAVKPLTRKRAIQKRSKVWQYFEQATDGTEAKCKSCFVVIKTDSGNTSGLMSHLRSTHSEQYDEIQGNTLDNNSGQTSRNSARNSPVWQFYTEIESNR